MPIHGSAARNDVRERTLVGYAPAPVPGAESEFDTPSETTPGEVSEQMASLDDAGGQADSGSAPADSFPRDRRNPLSRRQPINRGRHLSRQFFEEGERQQENGWENSPLVADAPPRDSAIDFKSFDEVPSRRGPLIAIAVAAVTAVVGVVGWTIFGVASSSSAPADQSAAALLQIEAPPTTVPAAAPMPQRPSSATVPPVALNAFAAAPAPSPVAPAVAPAPAPPALEVPPVVAQSARGPVARRLAAPVVPRAQPARKAPPVRAVASLRKAPPMGQAKALPARAPRRGPVRAAVSLSPARGAALPRGPVGGDGVLGVSPPASDAPSMVAPAAPAAADEGPSRGEAAPAEATAADGVPPLPPASEIVPPAATARPEPPPASPDVVAPVPVE